MQRPKKWDKKTSVCVFLCEYINVYVYLDTDVPWVTMGLYSDTSIVRRKYCTAKVHFDTVHLT